MTGDEAPPTGGVLGVGLIGYGRWGANVARDLAACPGVALTHIVDTCADARARGAAAFPRAKLAERFEICLGQVDAVAVCTPAVLHFEHARAALEAGRHVFVEKPMAMATHQAESLRDQARSAELTLAVGHQMLFHELFSSLCSHWRAPAERISSIESHRCGGIDLDTEPDVLWAYGPHDVAMVLALTGADPSAVEVSGISRGGERGALTALTIELGFESGARARIMLDCRDGVRRRDISVTGPSHRMCFEDDARGGRLITSELDGTGPDRIIDGGRTQLPLARELSHFVRSAAGETSRLDGGEMGVRVVRVLSEAARLAEATSSRSAPVP